MPARYSEFVQEQVQATQSFSKPVNDPFSNTYNPAWRNHLNFSWRTQPQPPQNFSQPFKAPYPQPNTFPKAQTITRPHQLNPSFEDKVLQAFKGLETNKQLLIHIHSPLPS